MLKINQACRISGFLRGPDIKEFPRHVNQQQDENFFNGIYHALEQHRFWQGELWAERKAANLSNN